MNQIDIKAFKARFQIEGDFLMPEKGSFPQVIQARDVAKEIQVSIKLLPLQAKMRKQPAGSLEKRLNSLTHPHLLSHNEQFSVVEDAQEKKQAVPLFDALVYDHIEGGNLTSYAQEGLPIRDKERIIEGIMEGLEVLHKQKVVHGNLKPNNILIQDVGHPHARLTDFGLAPDQQFENLNVNFSPGSIAYAAPELLAPQDFLPDGKPGPTADMWALGIIIYELFAGAYPFGDKTSSNTDLAARICLMDIPEALEKVPSPYRMLVEECLQRTPADRPKTVKAAREFLKPKKQGKSFRVTAPKPKTAVKKEKTSPRFSFAQLLPKSKPKPKPVKIACKYCGSQNEPSQVVCFQCKHALGGPESLRFFRTPTAIGSWAAIFFSLLLVPVAFFYKSLYELCDFSGGGCNIGDQFANLLQSLKASRAGEEAMAALGVPIGFMIVSGILFYIFYFWWLWRSSSNLGALGSQRKFYHPAYLMVLIFISTIVALGFKAESSLLAGCLLIGETILSLLTLQEIWKGSDPSFLQAGIGWKQAKGSFLIFSRWALSFVFPILLFLPLLPLSATLEISQAWFFFWLGMIAAYWILTVLVIVRINMRQSSKYLAMAKHA